MNEKPAPEPRNRRLMTILVLILLATLYFVPKMVSEFMKAYNKGAEIRREQGR